jgi:hypothetical protein
MSASIFNSYNEDEKEKEEKTTHSLNFISSSSSSSSSISSTLLNFKPNKIYLQLLSILPLIERPPSRINIDDKQYNVVKCRNMFDALTMSRNSIHLSLGNTSPVYFTHASFQLLTNNTIFNIKKEDEYLYVISEYFYSSTPSQTQFNFHIDQDDIMDLLNVGPVKPIGYMHLLPDQYIPQLNHLILQQAKNFTPDVEYYTITNDMVIQKLEEGLIIPSTIYAVSRNSIMRLLQLNPKMSKFLDSFIETPNDPIIKLLLLVSSSVYDLNIIHNFILPFIQVAFGVETQRNTTINRDETLSEELFTQRYLRFTNPLPPWLTTTPMLHPVNSKTINNAKIYSWLDTENAQPQFAALIQV